MFAVRLITVILLVTAILIAYNPQLHERIMESWESARPAVVQLMDGLYATIRNMIAGEGIDDQMEHPPADPGMNFDRIVT